MKQHFKPEKYNSVSPYFIIENAEKFIQLVKKIFDAKELRRYDMPDGSIMHAELQIDDSVIMLGEASEKYPAIRQLVHVYVPEVEKTYKKAIVAGCESIEVPKKREGDPDRRGTFRDFAGNIWSIGTQLEADKSKS